MSDTSPASGDKPSPVLRTAPDILADIKSDLGITDSTEDAWVQRRIDGIWARMEVYTSRKLCAPPLKFADDWGNISTTHATHALPPPLRYVARGSVFLRCIPIVTIESVELDGSALAPADMAVTFDARTGKLFTLRASDLYAGDLSHLLRAERARIVYTAGWAAIPSDLYEIVLGAIQPLWSARKAQQAGGPVTGAITRIDVADVGSIHTDDAGLFVAAASKAAGSGADPLLGPYANMLDLYIDHRVRIGYEGQPTTELVP